jgi:predicted DNA-binding ribbon-helix-helix protein
MCGEDEQNDIVRLPAEILAKLRHRAASQNMTLNQLLAEIASEYLEHLEGEEGEES